VGITGDLRMNTSPAADSLEYYNGASWVTVQDKLQNPVTGTGTANRLAKFTGTSSLGNSPIVLTGDTLITFGVSAPGQMTFNTNGFPNTPGQMPYTKFRINTGSGGGGITMGDPTGPLFGTQTALQFTTYDGTASGGFDYWSTRLTGDGFGNFHISNSPANSDGDTVMTNRLSITAAGKVGINKSAPDSTLDVTGSSRITGNTLINGKLGLSTISSDSAKVTIRNTNSTVPALNIVSGSNIIGSNNIAVNLDITPNQVNQTNTGFRIYQSGAGEGSNIGYRATLNARDNVYGVYSDVTKIWPGGSSLPGEAVGVYGSATTSSNAGSSYGGKFENLATSGTGYGLYVNTTSAVSGSVTPFAVAHKGTVRTVIDTVGRVGIGTTSPSRTLHISATDAVRIPRGTTSDRGTGANGDIRYSTTNNIVEWYDTTGNWRQPVISASATGFGTAGRLFYANASGLAAADEPLYWDATNNRLGIGVASPTEPLDVLGGGKFSTVIEVPNIRNGTTANNVLTLSGNAAASGNTATSENLAFNVGNNGATRAMTILNNGRVGIGTASPGNLIDVSGTVAGQSAGVNLNAQNLNATGITRFRVTNNSGAYAMMAIGGSSYGVPNYINNALFSTDNSLYFLANHNTPTNGGGTVNFTAGGFENNPTMTITPGNPGNVGIGTTSPSNILHVSGNVSGTTGVNLNAQNLNSTGITRFRVTNNTGAFAMMAIGGSAYSGGAAYQNNALFSTDNTLYFLTNHNTGTGGAGNINFTAGGVNNNPTMNIRPGNPGEVSVGGIADNGAYNLQCNGTGVWGAGAYQNGSDARIKENIAPLDSSLATVMQLKPVTFNYIPSFSKDQSTQPGFIAQDLQQALEGKNYINGVVSQGEQYMSVAYQTLIPLLTKAIQEQQAQIEALKKEIEQLKNK